MTTNPKGYKDPAEALTQAILMVQDVLPAHDVTEVKFGEFSASVGGGFYVSIRVVYTLGNTIDSRPTQDVQAQRSRRLHMAIMAWQEKFGPRIGDDRGSSPAGSTRAWR